MRLNAEEAMKHPWILELKKKSSKEIRPKHRLRREAETSIEHNDNTRKLIFWVLLFIAQWPFVEWECEEILTKKLNFLKKLVAICCFNTTHRNKHTSLELNKQTKFVNN